MIRVFLPGLLLLLMLVCAVRADDVYDVLRRGGDGYAEVLPGKPLLFPRDHLPHPDYRIEWWYLTANLDDASGREWGVQWTLFRHSLNPDGETDGWNSNQVWMAHAALSTPDGHVYEERFARGGIGQAGVGIENGRFDAWLDDWRLRGDGPAPLPGRLIFSLSGITVDLALDMYTPWILQGDRGYSRKSAQGQASYYYSQPHVRLAGAIEQAGQRIEVSGPGWLDREWSSQPLAQNQPGWDWFSLHLRDGSALMVYRLRHNSRQNGDNDDDTVHADVHDEDWISGTWVGPAGEAQVLNAQDIELRPLETRRVRREQNKALDLPLVWSLALPANGPQYRWIVRAPDPDHWLETAFPYWEGPVVAEGDNPGRGYLEMTGYR